MNIYSKPDLYDAIHKNYIWDIKLLQNIAKNVSGPVLELASGTGRLAIPILDLGFEYTGIDLSPEFHKMAKNIIKGNFILGDMQCFELKKKFGFIFIGFNSFLHNLTIQQAKNTLICVKNHLTNKGTFLMSAFIPDPSFLFREKSRLYPASSYFKYKNSQCKILEKNTYDQDTQINQINWYIERDGKIDKNFTLRIILMRWIFCF